MKTPHRSRPSLRLAVAMTLATLSPSLLHAANRFWVDTNGDDFGIPGDNSTNWSPFDNNVGGVSVPTTTDIAYFTQNSTYTVTFSSDVTNLELNVTNGTVTFDLNARTYLVTSLGAIEIGGVSGQTGRLIITDGTLGTDTNGDDVRVGNVAGSSGFLTVASGGRLGDGTIRPDLLVGAGGSGTLTVNDNGRIDVAAFTTGDIIGSTGTVTISGLNAVANVSGAMKLGDSGASTMNVTSGGTLTSASTVTLGTTFGADGAATISGFSSSWAMASTCTIGNAGDGTLAISSGGLVSSASTVTLGSAATGFGTATVTGANSRWNLSGTQFIGSSGLGIVTVSSGGQIVSSAGATLGSNGGSEGRVTVTGAGSQWTAGGLILVGSAGTADLTISAGGAVSAQSVTLAAAPTGSGVVTVTGTGSKLTTTGAVSVAFTGDATLRVASGAEVTVGTNLTVFNPAGTPSGTLDLDGGSIFVTGDFTNNGVFNFTNGLLQVKGNFQPNAAVASLTINGTDGGDLPTLDLIGSGTTTNVTTIAVGDDHRGQLLLRQGRSLSVGSNSITLGASVGGEGIISVQSGASLSTTGSLGVGGGAAARGTGTLNISGGTVSTSALRLYADGTIHLNNGTLALNSPLVLDGQFDWTAGTLRFDADISLSNTNVPKLLGLNGTVRAGQVLTSAGGATVTLDTPVVVDGGTLSPGALVNNSTLEVRSGSASVAGTTTNRASALLFLERTLSLGGTLTNNSGARLELAGGTGRLAGAGAVQNNGLILGDGTITNPTTNNATGKIRVDAGKTLFFTGAFSANAGELQLQGGTLDFTGAITNGATGFIAGRGALYAAGITNSGQMAFSGGTTDIHGDVTNVAGGRIVTSGTGTTTFFDDVVHNGTEIRTSAGSESVFFGAVSGAGPYTGTGTVYFEGDLRPGNSPASVLYEGDLVFGGGASLTLEIGGLALGSQYDHMNVGGTFTAGGALDVVLSDGFTPQFGDTFDLFDAGNVAGSFDVITLPELAAGLTWDDSQLQSTGALRAVPEPSAAFLMLAGTALFGLRTRPTRNTKFGIRIPRP